MIFRHIRAFHTRLCKIPINNHRCISIDTFPHPAPRIPHPVIFPRLCTFPIKTRAASAAHLPEVPNPKSEVRSPPPAYIPHIYSALHQQRHLPDSLDSPEIPDIPDSKVIRSYSFLSKISPTSILAAIRPSPSRQPRYPRFKSFTYKKFHIQIHPQRFIINTYFQRFPKESL